MLDNEVEIEIHFQNGPRQLFRHFGHSYEALLNA